MDKKASENHLTNAFLIFQDELENTILLMGVSPVFISDCGGVDHVVYSATKPV